MSAETKQSSEVKDKYDNLTGKQKVLLLAVCFASLIGVSIYDHKNYPLLARFGLEKWETTCNRGDWVYRFSTDNPRSSEGLRSIHRRGLALSTSSGERLYRTGSFNSEALDQEGVWRFSVRKDTRLFVKKDKASVLQGDEERFDFTYDLRGLKLYLKDGGYEQLSCTPS